SLNTSATVDPYVYKLISKSDNGTIEQRRLDRYAWNNGKGLGQISNFRAAINLNLQGKSKSTASEEVKNQEQRQRAQDQAALDPLNDPLYQQDEELQQVVDHIRNNPEQYVDFKVPWSLRTNYSFTRQKTGFRAPVVRKTMSFGGSLGLTDKTQITWNSGYDFENNEFTTTNISVHRDLHCWVMDFNWVPFGTYQSYMLTIRVKAQMLQDLKVEKRKSNFDFFGDSQF
ncbi:MAG: LPS-assembly protein LptD, partial [Cyclobacteriaceae bacterium]